MQTIVRSPFLVVQLQTGIKKLIKDKFSRVLKVDPKHNDNKDFKPCNIVLVIQKQLYTFLFFLLKFQISCIYPGFTQLIPHTISISLVKKSHYL